MCNFVTKMYFIIEVIGSCKNQEQLQACVNWVDNLVDKNILNKYHAKTLMEIVCDMREDVDYVPRSDFDQLTEEEQRRELDKLIPGELHE